MNRYVVSDLSTILIISFLNKFQINIEEHKTEYKIFYIRIKRSIQKYYYNLLQIITEAIRVWRKRGLNEVNLIKGNITSNA